MTETLRLLCVHQGSELYGSDRVFIQSVKAIRQRYPNAVLTVHVPKQGPLIDTIKEDIDKLVIDEMFVLRLARIHLKNWRNLGRIVPCLQKAWKNLQQNDAVYISTSSIFGYLLLARFSKKKIILHLHEYADGLAGFLLRFIVRFSGVKIIANSQATAKAFDPVPSQVILNGIAEQTSPREILPLSPLNLLLVGRINSWKGQGLAIEAVKKLAEDGFRDIRLNIVGDVFEDQAHYRDILTGKVEEYNLQNRVLFHGFVSDPHAFYKNAHVVIVPSTRPEPFGLVAIEGMMWSLPVIAADHGGLREIVVHNETGFLVQPNGIDSLAEAIRKYAVHLSLLQKHGDAGRIRYDSFFTEERYLKQFTQVIEEYLA